MLADDVRSFHLMFQDMAVRYHVDSYWRELERENRLVSQKALNTFRDGSFASYTGSIKKPRIKRPRIARIVLTRLAGVERRLRAAGYSLPFSVLGDDPEALRQFYGEALFCALNVRGRRLATISDSGFGGPADAFSIGGKFYTHAFLTFFHRFLVMDSLVDFERVESFLEIGGSYGGQIEVVLKLHPAMRCALVEIPPQLYVAQQYLDAVFPDRVVKYDEVRALDTITRATFGDRSIIVIAPWQVEKIAEDVFDVVTNQRSFQEMAQATVQSYCQAIQRVVRRAAVLFEHRQGHPAVATPVTREDYIRYLRPAFELTREIEECAHTAELGDGRTVLLNNDIYCFERTVAR